jgi:type IV pilus assembly protein PilB
MGIAPFLVSSSLMGIIAQRLVRVLCPFCKEKYALTENMCRSLGAPEGTPAWKPVGCNECRGTGYKGRAGIFEILVVNDTIRRMIVANASTTDLREEAIKLGMKTLRTSGVHKVLAGVTSVEEVFEVSM